MQSKKKKHDFSLQAEEGSFLCVLRCVHYVCVHYVCVHYVCVHYVCVHRWCTIYPCWLPVSMQPLRTLKCPEVESCVMQHFDILHENAE